jgi:hypothetical protein
LQGTRPWTKDELQRLDSLGVIPPATGVYFIAQAG